MNRFFYWLAIGFFVVTPFWCTYQVVEDFMRPEEWDNFWGRDPRIYLPMAGAVLVFGVVIAVRILTEELRIQRQLARQRQRNRPRQ